MPSTYAAKFVEECRLNYNDSRWLKVKFDDMMFKALYMGQPEDIREEIIKAREELVEMIHGLYKENKWGSK